MNMEIQRAEIARQISYDPEAGTFLRLTVKPGCSASRKVGGIDAKGYLVIKIGGFVVKAHRLAWLMTYGTLPDGVIDHINGNKLDNRICNLRDVSKRVNALNTHGPRRDNTRSGLQGVSKISGRSKRWAARISEAGKRVHIGSFATPEEAHSAYLVAKNQKLEEALHAI